MLFQNLDSFEVRMNSFETCSCLFSSEKPTTALVLWRPPMSYLNVVKVPHEEECRTRSSVVITDITDRPDLDNNVSTIDLNSISLPSSVE